jgi:hypothetical protein
MAQGTMSAGTGSRRAAAEQQSSQNDQPRDLADHFMEYAKENPTSCAMWCFFAGFVLGWRLKPW